MEAVTKDMLDCMHKNVLPDALCAIKNLLKQVSPSSYLLANAGRKPHICPLRLMLCGNERMKLSKHKYVCEHCSYTTSITSHYKRHLHVHTGERPFACSVCSKGFLHSKRNNETLLYTLESRKYVCQLCSYSTIDRRNYKRHTRTHTGERP
ncbi:Zinc finger protein 281, partial [Stegodyphus mimosarum]